MGYDISPLKRVKFKILTTSKYRNPHVQLKDNLFLPLFNTNFISKFQKHAGKGTGHFNPLEDYRFFSPTGSARLKRRNNGRNNVLVSG